MVIRKIVKEEDMSNPASRGKMIDAIDTLYSSELDIMDYEEIEDILSNGGRIDLDDNDPDEGMYHNLDDDQLRWAYQKIRRQLIDWFNSDFLAGKLNWETRFPLAKYIDVMNDFGLKFR